MELCRDPRLASIDDLLPRCACKLLVLLLVLLGHIRALIRVLRIRKALQVRGPQRAGLLLRRDVLVGSRPRLKLGGQPGNPAEAIPHARVRRRMRRNVATAVLLLRTLHSAHAA